MPYKTREELQAHLDAVQEQTDEFFRLHSDYAATFPKWMKDLLPHLSFGQAVSMRAYQVYEENNEHSLGEGQHPHYAVIAPSFFTGHRNNILGMPEDGFGVGETLVYRIPAGHILDARRLLNDEAASFSSLAGMKELDKLFCVQSTGSELLNDVLDYYRSAEAHADGSFTLPAGIEEGSPLHLFLEKNWAAYEMVKARGVEYYENMLDFDLGDPAITKELSDELTHHMSDDRRIMRAMTIQILNWERDAIRRDKDAPKTTVAILQGYDSKREFVWSDKVKKYVIIPQEDENDPVFAGKKEIYQSKLPEELQDVSELMIHGAREYRKALIAAEMAMQVGTILDAYVISCSDSRATSTTILGPRADWLRNVLRTPGAFTSNWVRDAKSGELKLQLTKSAGRFIQTARNHGKAVVQTHHANCGAMGAIDGFLSGKNTSLPEAFRVLGEDRLRLYATVRNKGIMPATLDPVSATQTGRDEDIVAYYATTYGVPVKTIADCMGIQQALWDYQAAKETFPDVNMCIVYQNMTEKPDPQNYVLNPNTMKFNKIPAMEGILPKPAPRTAATSRRAACACCTGGAKKENG